MLSGIGEPSELNSVGIHPIVNLPEVGKNLQDHVGVIPMLWNILLTSCHSPLFHCSGR